MKQTWNKNIGAGRLVKVGGWRGGGGGGGGGGDGKNIKRINWK